jgi:F0F1-type ATP synthase membrane subunit c/vacuolar-type H+-ATPase subunit K
MNILLLCLAGLCVAVCAGIILVAMCIVAARLDDADGSR